MKPMQAGNLFYQFLTMSVAPAIGFVMRIDKYKQFIEEGKGQSSPWALLSHQVYLGSETFVEKMHSLIDGDKELSEIPSS